MSDAGSGREGPGDEEEMTIVEARWILYRMGRRIPGRMMGEPPSAVPRVGPKRGSGRGCGAGGEENRNGVSVVISHDGTASRDRMPRPRVRRRLARNGVCRGSGQMSVGPAD